VMVAMVLLARLIRRRLAPGRALLLALVGVLLIDPLAPASPGFWLSFTAVGLILYTLAGRVRPRWHWWHWGGLQLVLALGLAPLLAVQFQQLSLVAPLANLVAVPLVGLLVVPLVLLAILLVLPWPAVGGGLLALADRLLELAWSPLAVAADWPLSSLAVAGAPWPWALAGAAGVALLLLPRGVPLRLPGLVLLLPVVTYRPALPLPGEAWLELLDVGQGLAALVRTRNHLLLFDTGPRYGAGRDAGNSIVLPYLAHLGIDGDQPRR